MAATEAMGATAAMEVTVATGATEAMGRSATQAGRGIHRIMQWRRPSTRAGIVGAPMSASGSQPDFEHAESGKDADVYRWSSNVRKRLIMQRLKQPISFEYNDSGAEPSVQINLEGDGCDPIVRPTTAELRSPAEIGSVLGHARLRYEREAEIHVQMSEIVPFFGAVVNLRGDRHKYTWELLECVIDTAIEAHMPVKAMLGVKRPADIDPHVQPMLPDPGHASYPSGHATESHAISGVLFSLLESACAFNVSFLSETQRQFERIAQRISTNRIVAGLHYPADNRAGEKIGVAVASHVKAMCKDESLGTIESSLWAKAKKEWS